LDARPARANSEIRDTTINPVQAGRMLRERLEIHQVANKRVTERAASFTESQILKPLTTRRLYTQPFVKDVDERKDEAPDYYKHVKKPMCITTIRRKLHGQRYRKVSHLLEDFELVVSTSVLYNGRAHPVTQAAEQLFESTVTKLTHMADDYWAVPRGQC
jgi:hypothetical protein